MKKLFALMLVMSSSLAFGVTTVTFDDGTVVELAQNENLFVSTDSLYSLTKITAGNGEISYKFAPVTPVTKGEEVSETVEESNNETTADSLLIALLVPAIGQIVQNTTLIIPAI